METVKPGLSVRGGDDRGGFYVVYQSVGSGRLGDLVSAFAVYPMLSPPFPPRVKLSRENFIAAARVGDRVSCLTRSSKPRESGRTTITSGCHGYGKTCHDFEPGAL